MPGKIGNAGTEGHMGIPGKEKNNRGKISDAGTDGVCAVLFYVTVY
jgi:hypothetical protein